MFGISVARVMPVVGVCLLGLALQGCSPKVDCNGAEVKEDVIAIVKESLDKAAWYSEMVLAIADDPTIDNVKTLTKNDELKQAECVAQYSFVYNGKPRQVEVEYNLAYLQDKKEIEVLAAAEKVKAGLMQIAMREAPVKNRTQEIFDPKTGKLVQSIAWKDNVKNGKQRMWTSDGETLIADIDWVDGKSNGWEKHPDADGKIVTDLTWKAGLQTGYQTTFWGVGTPRELVNFKDGKLEGVRKIFDRVDGQIVVSREEHYKDGVLDGIQRHFRDGNVEREVVFRNGEAVSDSLNAGSPAGADDAAQASSPAVDACVDAKIANFRKLEGDEVPISHDVLTEWTTQCKG